jgi:hypothetical protein
MGLCSIAMLGARDVQEQEVLVQLPVQFSRSGSNLTMHAETVLPPARGESIWDRGLDSAPEGDFRIEGPCSLS